MAAPISVGIAADANDFAQGVRKGVIEPLENVVDTYADIVDASRKAGGDNSLERTMRDQQAETDKLSKRYSVLSDDIRAAGSTGKRFGDQAKEGTDKASDGMEDFKSEANSTARETAASIGSVEDALGAVQEVAANALGGFGPAGAAAGLAAAVGIGLVTAELDKQKERAQEVRDGLVQAYLDASIAGRNFLTEEETIAAARAVIEKDDQASRDKRAEDAKLLGLTTSTLILAEAGDRNALSMIEDTIAAKRRAADQEARANGEAGRDRASQENIALDIVADKWTVVRDNITEATERGKELTDVQIEQERKTRDAQNAMIGGYASAVLAAASAKSAVEAIPTQRDTNVRVQLTADTTILDRELARPRVLKVTIEGRDRGGQVVI